MFKSRRRALTEEYGREKLKQTQPYDYYVNIMENKTEGRDTNHVPLSCDIEIIEEFDRFNWPDEEKTVHEVLKKVLKSHKIAYVMNKNNIPAANSGNISIVQDEQQGKTSRNVTDKITQLPDYFMIYKEGTTPDINVITAKSEMLNQDLIYFDEDYVDYDGLKRYAPFFKPDYSPDTLLEHNYINSLFLIDYKVLSGMVHDGIVTMDDNVYDLLLKVDEKIESAQHIPAVGSHISRNILETDINELHQNVYDEYVISNESDEFVMARERAKQRRNYAKLDAPITLSIIIPSKDNCEILEKCLESLKIKGGFNKYRYFESENGEKSAKTEKRFSKTEVIIVDNGSNSEQRTKITGVIKRVNDDAERSGSGIFVKYIYKEMEFNFSEMCNIGAKDASGDYLMFMNDDVEVTDEDAIYRMCEYASMDKVGTVGAKLYYPGGIFIQHSGITDLACGPSHKLSHHPDDRNYYFGINRFNRNVLASTAACIIIKKEKYFNIDGFNGKMKVGYNDVDLALKAIEHDYRNILLNDISFIHHESLSRGSDTVSDEKYLRLKSERQLMYDSHTWLKEKGDPYYNINLVNDTLDYFVNVVPEADNRAYRSEISIVDRAMSKPDIFTRVFGRGFHFNSENVIFERGIMSNEEDYYVFSGWAVGDKKDNSLYERKLLIIDENDKKTIIAEMAPKFRTDVKEVFTNAVNAELAGYVCNIPANMFDSNKMYKFGVIFKNRITGLKYIVLGDNYERTGSN